MILLIGDIGEEIRVNNKWPATMLAASRTESVIGRIILLVSSIITINGISKYGVPVGVRWERNLSISLMRTHNTYDNQENKAILNVNVRCLEAVNT